MEQQTLREVAATALLEDRVKQQEENDRCEEAYRRSLVTNLRRQGREYLNVELEGDVEFYADGDETIALVRHEDLWLGFVDGPEREGGPNLTVWERCEECAEWFPIGRYAYDLAALGRMLAAPDRHGCGEHDTALEPVLDSRQLAEAAIANLDAALGNAEDAGATRVELLGALGLLALCRTLQAQTDAQARAMYAGVI